MQLNRQELAIIAARKLPIKIFAISNRGYASIRNMQNSHFRGHYLGCDEGSGLYLPSLEKLASGYGIGYMQIRATREMRITVETVLKVKAPMICEVIVEGDCLVTPRTATQILPDGTMRSSPLENQYPFLSTEELEKNCL